MMSFVTKLLMSGQFKFEDGQISIFDQRVLIFPMGMMKIIIEKSVKDAKFASSIYEAAKVSVVEFCTDVTKRLGIEKREDMLNMLFSLTQMNGYGVITPIKVDYEKKTAVMHLRGLPSVSLMRKFKGVKAADVYWCGLVAGGMSFIFGSDVDAVETRCVISGKESCEIVAGNKKYLSGALKKAGLKRPPYM